MYKPPEVKPPCPPDRDPRFEDVIFAEVSLDNGEPFELKMDIYQDPKQEELGPCIVYFFGGGWMWGDYKQQDNKAVYFRDILQLVDQGMTVVSPSYRLAGQSVFPACIHDSKGAIRFLKANSTKYNIDPEKIAVLGNSAGAHLAAMVAMSANDEGVEGDVGGNLEFSSSIKAAALYYTPSDICEMIQTSASKRQNDQADNSLETPMEIESLILGYTGPGKGLLALSHMLKSEDISDPDWKYIELAKKCSPINYASSDCPPLLILHGGKDPVVSIKQSEMLYKALVDANAEATYLSYSFGAHGPSLGPEVDQFAYRFLTSRLYGKEDLS